MNPLGLLIGGRTMAMASVIIAIGMFGVGAHYGAIAATDPGVAFYDVQDEQMSAVEDVRQDVSTTAEEPDERLVYEWVVKPLIDTMAMAMGSGLGFGYNHPLWGMIAGKLYAPVALVIGLFPFFGGME